MQRNTLKEKLKAGQCVYGTSLEDCLDPEIAVVLSRGRARLLLHRHRTFPCQLQPDSSSLSGRTVGGDHPFSSCDGK